jgi:hypothetical protein
MELKSGMVDKYWWRAFSPWNQEWICQWLPTFSSDNTFIIIMGCGLFWWLKLGWEFGRDIARLRGWQRFLVLSDYTWTVSHFLASSQLVWGLVAEFSLAGLSWRKCTPDGITARGRRITILLNFAGVSHQLYGDWISSVVATRVNYSSTH